MNFECPRDTTEESKIVSIASYRRHPLKFGFYLLLSLFSCLIAPLITRWSVTLAVWLKYTPTKDKYAEILVITDVYGTKELVYLKRGSLYINNRVTIFKTFVYRYQKYYYDASKDLFRPVPLPLAEVTCEEICNVMSKGISSETLHKQLLLNHGRNVINVQLKSNIMIFVDEILSPFYIFQILSVILWVFFENYYIYAGIIFGTSTITMLVTVINIKKNLKDIKRQAEYVTKIKVRRPYNQNLEAHDYFEEVSSIQLVPGDVVEINADERFPCDLALLNGTVVVDESMLTGESIPVFKEALDDINKPFTIEDFTKNVLFAGTKCLDKKASNGALVTALVVNTGFSTTRAKLIKSFLFSPPDKYSNSKDSAIFIGGLAAFAIIGFSASVSSMIDLGVGAKEIVIKSLDLITTALPPALTTVLSVGAEVSVKRLKSSNITSKTRNKINLAGKVEVMCFDKTGTLTEDTLKLKEVAFKTISKGGEVNIDKFSDSETFSELIKYSPEMLYLMASCHSLTHIKKELRGDPLELDMFKATQWLLFEEEEYSTVSPSNNKSDGINILKRFDFVPDLQRMSVIVEFNADTTQCVFVKGSPEKVLPLCQKDSVPTDIWAWIALNAKEGYRIIACAQKKIQKTDELEDDRDLYESDLEFIGLLNFENQLRDASLENIVKFKEAGLRTIMLTGDNPLTSIHAGKSCSILEPNHNVVLATINKQDDSSNILYQLIPHSETIDINEISVKEKELVTKPESPHLNDETTLPIAKDQPFFKPLEMKSEIIEDALMGRIALAITGEALSLLQKDSSNIELYQLYLKKGSIFSRMSPNQKAHVIGELMQQGYIVGMCGDGANDSAALKRAHVGLSIGNGEASLASPFSTSIQDISGVDILLREGRAALCTSIQCFKYMSMYSVIQTTTMIILYLRRSNLTEWSFNYADMILNFPLAVCMSFSGPGPKLARSRPEGKLISRYVLSSVLGLGVLQSTFQIVVAVLIPRQEWYIHTNELHPNPSDYNEYNLNYDSTCLFVFATFQYISSAVAFSFGRPHRISMFKNKIFLTVLLITTTLSFLLLFANFSWIKIWMEHLIIPSTQFKWIIFALAMTNFIIVLAYERLCLYLHEKRTAK